MKNLEIIAEKLTASIGTPTSILVHTVLFVVIFSLKFFGFKTDDILLILTTAVSLEAIYLSIFIQMSVNKTKKSLEGVEKDIDEIQEDVEDIQEDVDDLNEEDAQGESLDDQMIKTIKDIENKLTLLHKEIVSNKK